MVGVSPPGDDKSAMMDTDPAQITLRKHRPFGSLSHTLDPPAPLNPSAPLNYTPANPGEWKRSTAPEALLLYAASLRAEDSLTSSCESGADETGPLREGLTRMLSDQSLPDSIPPPDTDELEGDVIPPLPQPISLKKFHHSRLTQRRGSAPVILQADLERLQSIKEDSKPVSKSKDDSFATMPELQKSVGSSPPTSPRLHGQMLRAPRSVVDPVVEQTSRPGVNIRRGSLPVEMLTMTAKRKEPKTPVSPAPGLAAKNLQAYLHGLYTRSSQPIGATNPHVFTTPGEVKQSMRTDGTVSLSTSGDVAKAVKGLGAVREVEVKKPAPVVVHEKKKLVRKRDLNAWAPNSM